jgi:DNA-binding NarL/FixJ family response regulator
MPTRLLLVEDHALVRTGIRALLGASEEMQVVGEASNGHEAVELCKTLKPDIVLMDLALGDMNGIQATREIGVDAPEARVIMLSMHCDQQYIYESLRAGARGYLPKSAAFTELLVAIGEVMGGRNYVSPSLAGSVIDDYVRRAQGTAEPNEAAKLSPREREVIELIAEGNSSAEVARRLHISVRTVDTHRHNIMQKLRLNSIAALTKFAIRNGLCFLQ